jgi:hypothetical protein
VSIIKGGYNDPECEGNSAKYHTGKVCVEPGCNEPAGTAWSPHWCMKHNIERIDRIDAQLTEFASLLEGHVAPEEAGG